MIDRNYFRIFEDRHFGEKNNPALDFDGDLP